MGQALKVNNGGVRLGKEPANPRGKKVPFYSPQRNMTVGDFPGQFGADYSAPGRAGQSAALARPVPARQIVEYLWEGARQLLE